MLTALQAPSKPLGVNASQPKGTTLSDAIMQGYLDEPEHRAERMALMKAAKEGLRQRDRTPYEKFSADFEAWRQAWREQSALLPPPQEGPRRAPAAQTPPPTPTTAR